MWHRRNRSFGAGDGRRLSPVFSILTLGVVLPSAGVLWFMNNEAMQNEHLAVRQRLADLYESQLRVAAGRMQSFWQESLSALEAARRRSDDNPVAAFAALVKSGAVDSVLFYHHGGAPAYPDPVAATRLHPNRNRRSGGRRAFWNMRKTTRWQRPWLTGGFPGRGGKPGNQPSLYGAGQMPPQGGRQPAAIQILTRTFGGGRYRSTVGSQRRMLVPNALLFALNLMKEPSHPQFQKTAELLVEWLNDYQTPAMPQASDDS